MKNVSIEQEQIDYLHNWITKRSNRLGKLRDAKSQLESTLCREIADKLQPHVTLTVVDVKTATAPAAKKPDAAASPSSSESAAAGAATKAKATKAPKVVGVATVKPAPKANAAAAKAAKAATTH